MQAPYREVDASTAADAVSQSSCPMSVGVAGAASVLALASQTLGGVAQPIASWMTIVGGAVLAVLAIAARVLGRGRRDRAAPRLGAYQLGRKLGEGAMGVVYHATHAMLGRPAAVKLLPVERAGEDTIARFQREVQQTSRLEHPNSVRIYDYGRAPDGQFYYAMEYLDGVTLEDLVKRDGPVSPARAATIVRQAARALAEAHAMGLVHRDIKPANIMVCEHALVPDTVKVLDFGLVKDIDSPADSDITRANAVIGTPHYLAPESISHPAGVGPAADVYALGALAYFLVTGREVFTGSSVIEVCSKHLNHPPEPPSTVLGRSIDRDFEALILRCLAKQPAHRPADGAALADALDALDLPGWSVHDARAWWRARPANGRGPAPDAAMDHTLPDAGQSPARSVPAAGVRGRTAKAVAPMPKTADAA